MKKRYLAGAVMLTALLSVGFRYNVTVPPISSPHNIYLYDTLMLVSDSLSGLMIYSVKDPGNPHFKTRIPLSGNRGMAMKDSIIYANSYGGIVALQLINDTNYRVTAVIKDDPYRPDMMFFGDDTPSLSLFSCGGTEALSGTGTDKGTSSGAGGSYAVFAVIDSFLYYISNQSVITMDIRDAAHPVKLSETFINWDIETLFPTEQYLFVGGRNGMYILDRSNPAQPASISQITHFRAYDPVVVRDTMAYVTLRTNTNFRATQDELMVINLSSITTPKLIQEMPLVSPYGLAISDTFLYVGQGGKGMTLFSLATPQSPLEIKHWATPSAKDFIWDNDLLYMMCMDRVRIYRVTDPANPVMLSEIE